MKVSLKKVWHERERMKKARSTIGAYGPGGERNGNYKKPMLCLGFGESAFPIPQWGNAGNNTFRHSSIPYRPEELGRT
ncbi:hypothetical protein Cenrod_0790 [Candidatus Symbiobacter mobilis CR]|uniref:Uncharacterized protein n=1 Tax=Candidatus Symbiobacter mobilis CR TaxID=946483 RepID=U5N5Y0_9BURK|nr:hypothetical protein Cenrod_0790 [Candidatus Symbiobacter mobilis CR]